MKLFRYPEREAWEALLKRPVIDHSGLEPVVAAILKDVRENGDAAVRRYTLQFDKAELDELAVRPEEIEAAERQLGEPLKQAIRLAKENITAFHEAQRERFQPLETMPGVRCWRKPVGIEKVGLYIPGGTAPLFSTVLMLAVPAQLAGCKDIIVCTPPASDGSVSPALLYAAKLTGVTRVFRTGGVQAIAALAYGTESIPAVHKIFGPGNQYVTYAKQLVNKGGIAIDMPAGPSEVAVLADESSIPAFVAADLLSQAEHGIDSQVVLVTDHEPLIETVSQELEKQLTTLPRRNIAEKALENSRIFLVKSREEAVALLNEYAPEHLILCCKEDEAVAEQIVNAGSVFLGNYTPESAGDYASGTNHTLPTNGHAKAYAGVSLDSFVKKVTFQKITEAGLRSLAPAIEAMAAAEGLEAHRRAVSLRLPSAE